MKIVQINKYFYLKGGAERYMLELSAWLESLGHSVFPFAMQHPQNLESPYSQYFPRFVQTANVQWGLGGIKTVMRMLYSLSARRNLATLLHTEHPDIAHLHNIYTQLSPSILHTLKEKGTPVVMTVHDHHLVSPQYNIWAEGCGTDDRNVGILKGALSRYHKGSVLASAIQTATYKFHRWLRIYERNVDIFLCPSMYMKRQLIAGGIPKQKVRVIPYGMDATQVVPRFDHDGYFLFVGRLSDEKGVETIIRAAEYLPEYTFKIVGQGPQMSHLHALADHLENVELLGFRAGEELQALYEGAQAVLVPSRVHENFPLTVLEAMAAGKPVIASRVGGIPEMVEDRVSGLLVNPIDLEGWVEAIVRLAEHEDQREQYAYAARERVETHFKQADHYRQIMDTYKELV